jgi:hypothetical protein
MDMEFDTVPLHLTSPNTAQHSKIETKRDHSSLESHDA